MNHTTLYRKYRPQTLSELKGQPHVVSYLESILKSGNISHAYLFCGGRGTGKTSTARIFAQELGTDPADIYEMDAASNRGIDEIRSLRESVATRPFASRYKIYILDEAHMLTGYAANAFLKTLEEPPLHCIFILATTDEQKLPSTILSRCQVLRFKTPTKDILTDLVTSTAEKEGVLIDKDAAALLATLGDGSFRDTLGLLEQAIAISGEGPISVADVESFSQKSLTLYALDILSHCTEKDIEKTLLCIASLEKKGIDPLLLIEALVACMRHVVRLRYDARDTYKKELMTEMTQEGIDRCVYLSGQKDTPLTSHVLLRLLDTYSSIRSVPFAGYPLLEFLCIGIIKGANA